MSYVKNFLKDEEGQDMVEYTLLLAFVALAAGAAYVTIGNNISGIWSKAQTDITNAAAAAK
ncbi:MAG: Flp family type IVb pilin [Bryobacteraceae bacterium]|jgi:Flp pilus assembly pilin Flp